MEITDVKCAVLVVKTGENIFTLMFIKDGISEEYTFLDESAVGLVDQLILHIRKAMLVCDPNITA